MMAKVTFAAIVMAFVQLGSVTVAHAQGGRGRRGGAEITDVTRGGVAARAGMRTGDWIIKVDDDECQSADDVIDLIRNQRDVDITVARRVGQNQSGQPVHKIITFRGVQPHRGMLEINIRSGSITIRLAPR